MRYKTPFGTGELAVFARACLVNLSRLKALVPLLAGALWLLLPHHAGAQTSGVLREVYSGIGGTAVSDLTSSPNFPNNPNLIEVLPTYEAPTDVEDNYGQRLSAYVVAPSTGSYIFWIAGDDNCVLYLSTDEQPANKQLIASVPGWTASRAWDWYPEQQSAARNLTGGQRYYLEALMKEGGGGDNLAVRWQLPGGAMEEPIPGNRLQVYGLGPPQITQQPANVSVTEGGGATFSVQLAMTFGASFQWKRGGANISGATNSSYTLYPVTTTDSGAQFSCAITNGYGSTNSSTATLTVLADGTRPTILSASNLGDPTLVNVLFSEPVEAASGTNRLNYSIDNGIGTPVSASFGADFQSVILRTAPLSSGVTYTLTVNNVRDRAAIPNTILANSTRTFSLNFAPLPISKLRPAAEPRGPARRTTGLIINEVMYNPTNRPDGRNLEFVELHNSDITAENISGWRLSGTIEFTFPTNTIIAPGGYLVVAPAPADVQTVYGISGVLGGFTNGLANGSGTLRLRNKAGAIMLEVTYSDEHPWPVAADNAGHSLVLSRPSYGQGNPLAWSASDVVGGTPGAAETPGSNPLQPIFINEVLAHTDLPDVDFIELFNYSSAAVNLAGCILTDDPSTNKYVIPSGSIPAMGFVSFNQNQLGFALNAAGETVYLYSPNRSRVIDVIRFQAQANGVSLGRYPDGAPSFHSLTTSTPAASNSKHLTRDIVINEIMYNPLTGGQDDEYVELHNKGAAAANIGGWRLDDAVEFTFPPNFTIPAGGYAVVANNAARLLTNYPGLTTNRCLGNFQGSLANGGERIILTMPDEVLSTNGAVTFTNTIRITVDEVAYRDGGRWGRWSDGGGSSLELIDPRADNRRAPNWADSDESAKAPWTVVQYTGLLDHGNGAADEIQLLLQGAGECLIDDIEVLDSGNVNRVANSTFESGLTGWVPQGNHDQSSLENSGYNSSRSLHMRALGRGDTGANRVRTTLATSFSPGTTATIRFKVRWLKGHPEVLVRFHGNWLEAVGAMNLPPNLGTPGAVNSRVAANSGPAIQDVTHSPVLPAANQAVTVSAQVHDPDGLASLVLKYRLDPSTNLTSIAMSYNGAGLYSAVIPGASSGTMVAFHIQAADGAMVSSPSLFPHDAPVRECLVRFGEAQPSGNLGAYRIWITQNTLNRWNTRLKLDNGALDATFVYNNQRAVYNIGTLYSGSPWISPGYSGPMGGLCGYVLQFPADDSFLGATDFVMDWPIRDGTAQYEQIAYWMARELGLPYNHRRYVHMFVNGSQRPSIYEDTQQPNSDMVEQFFSDDTDGSLHKIEDWFEFGDIPANHEGNVDATLEEFTTSGGAKKLARYRWTWRKRATDNPNDYTDFFKIVDSVNGSGPTFTQEVEAAVNVEEWMRIFAVEHIAGNWDSYGYNRGKNMYVYKPRNGPASMMMWDIDFVYSAGGDAPDTSMFNSIGHDSGLQNLYNHPPFRRAYYRAWYDAVNGPMVAGTVNALMDAKYNALLANGVGVSNPQSGKDYIRDRRNYLLGELAAVASSFAIGSNGGNNFSTNRNNITLTGTAPVEVKTIKVNGIPYPVTWSSLTGWTLNLALAGGANNLIIQGFDSYGRLIAGFQDTITITYTGAVQLPQDYLVINEIMYNAATPSAGFIEIYNRSGTTAFDLSGYRLEGADFTFPGGTILQPGQFLVVAGEQFGFTAAYGASIPLVGIYGGNLDNGGETLKLVKPGATPPQDLVVDEVTYDDDLPWPGTADGFGPSLQLIDPAQDNNRVANWASVTGGGGGGAQSLVTITDAWRYNQTGTDLGTTWRNPAFNDAAWPSGAALLYNETAPLPAPANTPLTIGPSTFYFRRHFNFTGNPGTTTLQIATVIDDGAIVYLNGTEVLRLGMASGTIGYGDFANRTVTDAAYEGPFTISSASLLPGDNVIAVEVHQINDASTDVVFGLTLSATSTAGSPYTPGTVNAVNATTAALPLVWLNEVQPNNVTGPQDNAGDRDPWVELYNSSAAPIDLTGYYLSDAYANPLRWAFPAATILGAGQRLLVWLDGEAGETAGTNLHTNFRIPATTGAVVLTRTVGIVQTTVDYLNYNLVNNDRSYGAYPDGSPAKRRLFHFATPRLPNDPTYPAFPVTVNEVMAGNAGTIADPSDGDPDDWFELYNAGPTPVDLSGFTLTDNLSVTNMWTIPSGTIIPAGGYLLVWADDETNQNAVGTPDLHANFRLSLAGEAVGLYAPSGALVDSLTFGQQTNDISHGRWPDGNSSLYFMTTPTPRSANTTGGVISNAPPVLAAIGNRAVTEGLTLNFTASATDPDAGQTRIFSLDAGAPANASINPGSGVFTWTPTEAQGPGNFVLTVRVTDNGSPVLSDFETITISVSESNLPPVLTAIGNRNTTEGSALTFNALASDPDLPAQTLTYSLDVNAPPNATIDANTGAFSWTPTEAQGPGAYSVTFIVTDNGSPARNAAETITITVGESNSSPVLGAVANTNVVEMTALNLTLTAADPDLPANTLAYALVSGPTGASVNSGSGLLTWTPTEAQGPSTNAFVVRVTDNGTPSLSSTQSFSVVVLESNLPPVFGSLADQLATPGTQLTYNLPASDPDLPTNTLSYSLLSGPSGASVSSSTGAFTWTPTAGQSPSTNLVTVRVADNGSPARSATNSFQVIVSSVAPLRLTSVTMLPAGHLVLTWDSIAGKTYQVEYKDSLGTPSWTVLGTYPATSSSTSATNNSPGSNQRFYRVNQTN